ncbi:MAG: DNA-binding protein WhiA [Lachnospiraceae bacterium]|nr:DNA-binding protein WhiA [Lachnospiraceae bacterium]
MSFSSGVKEELSGHISSSRHCQIAEMAALFCYSGRIVPGQDGRTGLSIQMENEQVIRKCFTLLKKSFKIGTDVHGKGSYSLEIRREEDVKKLLQVLKLLDSSGKIAARTDIVNPLLIKNACCRRAYLRGAYLAAGSMSDPEKSYHLEFVCGTSEQARQLQEVIRDFGIEARTIIRKKHYVVYMKEGSGIVDLLNVVGAHISLMNLENLRIVKEMRNSINRRVNCEAANITKTVTASSKQIEDIVLIQKTLGLESLQESLREAAEIRLEYPEATLKELGQYLNPPVGKSGVNHRLRKLSEIAEGIRDK